MKAFALIDADRDGAITSEELVRVIEKVGGRMEEDEARGLIRRADSDKNGAISYEEFNTLWTSLKGGISWESGRTRITKSLLWKKEGIVLRPARSGFRKSSSGITSLWRTE